MEKMVNGVESALEAELAFWHGKRVFVTGHTGFKGAWLCRVLTGAGALVTGYALPPANPSLFSLSGTEGRMRSITGDVRDAGALARAFTECGPEIVFHLAAQPLVREGYLQPGYTYETNVMGTVNLLECARQAKGVRSILNVTTDKVYQNNEWEWGYRETDALDGFDPYSNSKSCADLLTFAYRRSFFAQQGVAVSVARAGNVIGGGDFAQDRILPDCVRAAKENRPVLVRNPASVRPYQHVLEPLWAYLLIARRQYEVPNLAGAYNIGPDDQDCLTTGALAQLFCRVWGEGATFETPANAPGGPHEATFLRLDCSRIKSVLGWRPRWDICRAVEKTVAWSKAHLAGDDLPALMDAQIAAYAVQGGGNA